MGVNDSPRIKIYARKHRKYEKFSDFLSSPPHSSSWSRAGRETKVKKAGSHGIPVNTKTHRLIITGMSCGSCSDRVARALLANPEVIETEISFSSEVGTVVTTGSLSTDDVVAIVAATGFGVSA